MFLHGGSDKASFFFFWLHSKTELLSFSVFAQGDDESSRGYSYDTDYSITFSISSRAQLDSYLIQL